MSYVEIRRIIDGVVEPENSGVRVPCAQCLWGFVKYDMSEKYLSEEDQRKVKMAINEEELEPYSQLLDDDRVEVWEKIVMYIARDGCFVKKGSISVVIWAMDNYYQSIEEGCANYRDHFKEEIVALWKLFEEGIQGVFWNGSHMTDLWVVHDACAHCGASMDKGRPYNLEADVSYHVRSHFWLFDVMPMPDISGYKLSPPKEVS